jgi:hypothetical protein
MMGVQLDFDGAMAWLDRHSGFRMFAATHPNTDNAGNTRLSVTGMLTRRRESEITLIDPAPGRVEVYRVGEGTLVLLEGEFRGGVAAELAEGHPEIVQLDFGDVIVIVGPAPAG